MKYMGGKSRISNDISKIIMSEASRGGQTTSFVSLFCGACSIESKVALPNKICNDKHPYLMAMWKELQNGWIPPNTISYEEYHDIKSHQDNIPYLTGFVGFGCSFGGKWFGGYARAHTENRNYAGEAQRGLLKRIKGLQNAEFTCMDYKDVIIPKNAIVYCDPPYANTTGYSLGDFNTDEFWDYMRQISKTNIVLISEQNAPDDFECIWEHKVKRTLDSNHKNYFKATEKLFKYKGELT